jgi:hypothetical protein
MTKTTNDVKNKILDSLISQMGGSRMSGSKNGSKVKHGSRKGSKSSKKYKKGSKVRHGSKKGSRSLKKNSKKGSRKGSNAKKRSKIPRMMSGLSRALNDIDYDTNDNVPNIHPQNDNENDLHQNNGQLAYVV